MALYMKGEDRPLKAKFPDQAYCTLILRSLQKRQMTVSVWKPRVKERQWSGL